jgi:putative membrane protein insertion efficiency factor
MRNSLQNIWHLPRKAIAALITGYQRTLSPDHGLLKGLYPYGFCRHEPTCSAYAKEQILKRGVLVGGILSVRRICRCNPWSRPSPNRILAVCTETRG